MSHLSGRAECLVALVDVDAAGGDLPGVVGPSLLADAEGLVALDLAARVLPAVHLDAGVPVKVSGFIVGRGIENENC